MNTFFFFRKLTNTRITHLFYFHFRSFLISSQLPHHPASQTRPYTKEKKKWRRRKSVVGEFPVSLFHGKLTLELFIALLPKVTFLLPFPIVNKMGTNLNQGELWRHISHIQGHILLNWKAQFSKYTSIFVRKYSRKPPEPPLAAPSDPPLRHSHCTLPPPLYPITPHPPSLPPSNPQSVQFPPLILIPIS